MSTIHSLLDHITAAGNLYGWRTDALLVGGALWALTAGLRRLRPAAR